jgi:hypothetical protein
MLVESLVFCIWILVITVLTFYLEFFSSDMFITRCAKIIKYRHENMHCREAKNEGVFYIIVVLQAGPQRCCHNIDVCSLSITI